MSNCLAKLYKIKERSFFFGIFFVSLQTIKKKNPKKSRMAANIGKIAQIIGPVVDVRFTSSEEG